MDRLNLAFIKQELGDRLADTLGERFGPLDISRLSQAVDVADGTTVFLLRDAQDRPRAVILCASPVAPGMIQRATHRALAAKEVLGEELGSVILDPLMEGNVQGISYAVMPYCFSLSRARPVWWMQRALLRPAVIGWLRRATERTVLAIEPAATCQAFVEPLREIASFKSIERHVRDAAELAIQRLQYGEWEPKHVLMHGDFWKGNILMRSTDDAVEVRQWQDRFIITDWAGSETRGFAIFDLIRMAQSMRMGTRSLHREIVDHCRLLSCQPVDATSYLLAALGHILTNIEYFPIHAYVRMVESCLKSVESISE